MKNIAKISLIALIAVCAILFAPSKSLANGTGALKNHSAAVAGTNRTYLVYQPTACQNKSCPVLFMFHQFASTASETAANYGWQETADKNDFLVVFPESLTLPQKDIKMGNLVIYPNYDIAGKHWDIANIGLPIEQRYTTQDVEFVKTILNELPNNYKILNTHIFSTGHSYGAFFSYYLSVCLPDKITAFAEHSGGYVNYGGIVFPIPARDAKANPDYNVPGLLLSSIGDNIVPYSWAQALQTELQTKGYTNEFVTLDAALGHSWDITKNQKQWDFLMAHAPALPTPPDTIQFAETNSSVNEYLNDTVKTVQHAIKLNLAGKGIGNISAKISVDTASTATVGTDFNIPSNVVSFNVNEFEKTLLINVITDDAKESDETIILKIEIANGNGVIGANSAHTIKIIDNTPQKKSVIKSVEPKEKRCVGPSSKEGSKPPETPKGGIQSKGPKPPTPTNNTQKNGC